MMRRIWIALAVVLAPMAARADVVTALPTRERVVALTFDACEAGKIVHIDRRVLEILLSRKTPFTVFVTGKFVRDNAADVEALARTPNVAIENHSWSHPKDMRLLNEATVAAQITRASEEIERVTGRRPTLFRFPGGLSDARTVAIAERLGYRVVHWRWPEGDPDPKVTGPGMVRESMARTVPGDILIFHINGRGVHTAEALPAIIDGLSKRGYRFVLLTDYLRP